MQIIDYQSMPLATVLESRRLITWRRRKILKTMTLEIASNIDRTGTLDFGINQKVLDPIPTVDNTFSKSLEQICDERAQQIISTGEPFDLYWSGGIDSTGVLVSMLKQNVSNEQMTVVLNTASIVEYPLFYQTYIKDKLNVRMVKPSLVGDINFNNRMVTGEIGDQLFGSIGISDYKDNYGKCLTDHWTTLPKFAIDPKWRILEFYEPFVAAAPFEIKSVYDLMWWINFACKWQHVVMRIGASAPSDQHELFMQNVTHFYRTEEFQQWSMNEENHRTLKTAGSYRSYKLALKLYIEEFTNDIDYTQFKVKIGSLPIKFYDRWMMLLDTGERIKFGRMGDDPKLYDEKYGDKYDDLFYRHAPTGSS